MIRLLNESQINLQNYCELYLFRHGQTHANRDKIIDGQVINAGLTTEGEEELKMISRYYKDIHFDAVFSSDLNRARQTAEILKAERDLHIQARKQLREKHFGAHEGISYDEYKKMVSHVYPELGESQGLYWNREKWVYRSNPEAETHEEVGTRYITELREIAIAYLGKRVLVVGHGTGLRSFIVKALGENFDLVPINGFKNGENCVVLSDGIEFIFKSFPKGKGYNIIRANE